MFINHTYVAIEYQLENGRSTKDQKTVEKVSISFAEDDATIIIENMSNRLNQRCHFEYKNKIFVRTCYKEIYAYIVGEIQINNNKKDEIANQHNHNLNNNSKVEVENPGNRSNVFAVIGTSGIGKSVFFLYYLSQYMKTSTCKSFYFQDCAGKAYFYEHVADNEFEVTEVMGVRESDTKFPLLVDMKTEEFPIDFYGPIIIFSSFRPGRYKEITKSGYTLVMPTWNYEEIKAFFLFTELTGEALSRLWNRYGKFGGTLRNILSDKDAGEIITKAINSKGADICKNYFGTASFGQEDNISDVLIHRNPPKKVDSDAYDYEGERLIYSFASTYIFKQLWKYQNNMMRISAKQKYDAGTEYGSEDGKEFELLCFHGFKFSNVKFKLTPLINREGFSNIDVVFPEIEIMNANWRTAKGLVANKLYLPPNGFMESADAFCVMTVNDETTLVALQVTIRDSHSVKKPGLKTICECFDASVGITNKILVFVTPVNGKLTKKQTLTDKQGVETNTTGILDSFITKQYKLENSLNKIV